MVVVDQVITETSQVGQQRDQQNSGQHRGLRPVEAQAFQGREMPKVRLRDGGLDGLGLAAHRL